MLMLQADDFILDPVGAVGPAHGSPLPWVAGLMTLHLRGGTKFVGELITNYLMNLFR